MSPGPAAAVHRSSGRAGLRDPTHAQTQTRKMGWNGMLSARCLRTILSTSGLHDVLYVHTVCSYGNTTGHTVTLGLTKTALAPASNKSRSAQIQATPRCSAVSDGPKKRLPSGPDRRCFSCSPPQEPSPPCPVSWILLRDHWPQWVLVCIRGKKLPLDGVGLETGGS